MAERTTRVDHTGGEPIAAKLEWTAAKLEPEERMGSSRSPERLEHERTPDRSSAMATERLAPVSPAVVHEPRRELRREEAGRAGWRHVPARFEAGERHGGYVVPAGGHEDRQEYEAEPELRRESPPRGWEGPWVPGVTRAAYEPAGTREETEALRGPSIPWSPPRQEKRAPREERYGRALEGRRRTYVPWSPGLAEQRRWELEGPTPEEREREAERQEHDRREHREESKGRKKAESKMSAKEKKEALVRDIDENRARLVEVVSELDSRRQEFMDPKRQFRRFRTPILGGAFGFLVLAGASIFLIVRRQQVRQRPLAKTQRLRIALARMIDRPEAAAEPSPSIRSKALASAATGASGVVAKKLVERIVASL